MKKLPADLCCLIMLNGSTKLMMPHKKTKARYETDLEPNAVDALKSYLQVRKVRSEKIGDETPLSIV